MVQPLFFVAPRVIALSTAERRHFPITMRSLTGELFFLKEVLEFVSPLAPRFAYDSLAVVHNPQAVR